MQDREKEDIYANGSFYGLLLECIALASPYVVQDDSPHIIQFLLEGLHPSHAVAKKHCQKGLPGQPGKKTRFDMAIGGRSKPK